MDTLLTNPAFRIYAICCVILGVKLLASALYTGTRRQKVGGFINLEDAKTFGSSGVTARTEEAPEVAHALRIQRNDAENIPLFFAIGLVYVLSGASSTGALILCGVFTIARVVHTLVYMRRLQPARAICFVTGVSCTVVMMFRIVMNVL